MTKEELDKLCADRELDTPEIFGENAFYGMDRIIKRYAGWPQERPLKAVIPHGIVMDRNFVSRAEKHAPVPAVFCYPEYREEAYQRQTNKWVIPFASPYLYLLELLEKDEFPTGTRPREKEREENNRNRDDRREGTLFFPAHSTHHVTAKMNYAELAERLQDLDSELLPVDICLYWRDYNLGRAQPFWERGFDVVTAGHMFDPDFLYRFYELCSSYRYAASNEIGSNLFYAVKSGCSFFFLREEVNRSGVTKYLPENMLDFDHSMADLIYSMFDDPKPQTTPEQSELVNRFLGTENIMAPDTLCKLLDRLDRMDKMGVWFRDRLPSLPWIARKMGRWYPGNIWRRLRERIAEDRDEK